MEIYVYYVCNVCTGIFPVVELEKRAGGSEQGKGWREGVVC